MYSLYYAAELSVAFGNAVASDCAWRNKSDACLRSSKINRAD